MLTPPLFALAPRALVFLAQCGYIVAGFGLELDGGAVSRSKELLKRAQAMFGSIGDCVSAQVMNFTQVRRA